MLIKNVTNRGVSFEYSFVAYNRDKTIVIWKYSNSISLPPNGQGNIGEISKSPHSVTSSNTSLEFGMENVKYQ
jgi:hypothetical protein